MDGRLMYCFPGVPGSIHDITILKMQSSISNILTLLKKTPKEILEEKDDEEKKQDTWAIIADAGYQGAQHFVRAVLPVKGPKTIAQMEYNKEVGITRVQCERYYGRMKQEFRIMLDRYRGDHFKFVCIFKICASLLNFMLQRHPLNKN